MFEHIGRKIKKFAKTLFWAGIVLSVMIGIMAAKAADSFLAFLLAVIVGFVVSYLSVIVLYMFGQLVNNSDIIAENSDRQVKLLKDMKAALAESYTGLCTKANRQANLLEEIRCELARCHAADAAEEAAEPVEEAPAAPVDVLTSITMEPEEAPVEEPEAEASPVPTITCKKCGFELLNEERDLSDSLFCPNCGAELSEQTELEGVCPGCGYDKAFGKFCPRCGLKQHD